MSFSIRVRVLLAVVLVSLVLAGGVEAEDRCRNRDGSPRPCTLSENVELCVEGTIDAYFQCVDERTNSDPGTFDHAWASTRCQLWLGIDQAACLIAGWKNLKM